MLEVLTASFVRVKPVHELTPVLGVIHSSLQGFALDSHPPIAYAVELKGYPI